MKRSIVGDTKSTGAGDDPSKKSDKILLSCCKIVTCFRWQVVVVE